MTVWEERHRRGTCLSISSSVPRELISYDENAERHRWNETEICPRKFAFIKMSQDLLFLIGGDSLSLSVSVVWTRECGRLGSGIRF